eukprot:CAMPEP_0201510048 /NCGR_PEP_ID=MMETSP0161_2-20130828/2902_1 /ASSEMBLY_ACC=CAM_ASM_000251 /TAXON_ID=180227 /ORGANISM="Neoparamoeba aestuarina, Strain SoJaBio B1-5/56/2" /LENGTH=394 /DNA_ID=CAMNT_0047905165 /DNA_START=62 /DNA_END=1246 /DNA_ORIENTATION=-
MLGSVVRFGSRSVLGVSTVSFRNFSSSPLEVGADGEIETQRIGSARFVVLNRPKALNALNLPQVRYLYPKYKVWDEDSAEKVIVLKGVGEKAFCAGGDIRSIYDSGMKEPNSDPEITAKFFFEEYQLNNRIATLSTPHVSLLDGITMGGGVGLSVHGKYRVAFNSSTFAMPETAIGFFCDVGGSYFLSRLSHNFGIFLGLSGARLKGADLVHFGIATHFCHELTPSLEEALQGISESEKVGEVLREFEPQGGIPASSFSNDDMKKIEECFGGNDVEDIVSRLSRFQGEKWAQTALKGMSKASPTSLKVVLKSLQLGKELDLKECLKMEYRMSQRFMVKDDFFTGVKATLITRDPDPLWKPSSLSEVTQEEVSTYFSHLSEERELYFDERDQAKL